MNPLRAHWTLDPRVVFLNHGSYGACPRAVLEAQGSMRAELEVEPVRFFRELGPWIDEARVDVAAFVSAQAEDVVFVRNATSGVNAVLRSLELKPGDELLTTDHAYGACRNAMDHVAKKAGATVVVAEIPFPIASPGDVIERVLARVTSRTVFALIDHITSPTGLVFPVAELSRELDRRGVAVMVDGAHGPGQVSFAGEGGLDRLAEAGVRFYAANFHKWTCAPKGAGLLWLRRDSQAGVHPTVISHGYRARPGRVRLHEEFDWTGTDDPTPWLCVPVALRVVGAMHEGGWDGVVEWNRALAIEGRRTLCEALGVSSPAPDSMIGSLGAVPVDGAFGGSAFDSDPLQTTLFDDHGIEVPVFRSPTGGRIVRVSAHLYNEVDEYRRLAEALAKLRTN